MEKGIRRWIEKGVVSFWGKVRVVVTYLVGRRYPLYLLHEPMAERATSAGKVAPSRQQSQLERSLHFSRSCSGETAQAQELKLRRFAPMILSGKEVKGMVTKSSISVATRQPVRPQSNLDEVLEGFLVQHISMKDQKNTDTERGGKKVVDD